MRDLKKSRRRGWSAGWLLPLVLLALPTCGLSTAGVNCSGNCDPVDTPAVVFDPGMEPLTSAVMCDIPTVESVEQVLCATDDELAMGVGIPLTEAAIALAEGENDTIGLDYAPAALALCNNKPRKTVFWGPFPAGKAVCLNCATQIPAVYADATAVCVAKCQDLINFEGGPLPADENVLAFCQEHARVSTNFVDTPCFPNVCSNGGTALTEFDDPRQTQEPVKWHDESRIGTDIIENSLTRTAATTGPNTEDFNAGAASDPGQLVMHSDGWVEFEASETNKSHVLGLASSVGCPDCTNLDPTLDDIGFAISLNSDGQVYVVESGPPFEVFGPFGDPYTVGERFRVHFKHNFDGTATISYSRVSGQCDPGTVCVDVEFYTHDINDGPGPQYPLRVDASFREQGATLANVTLVRIK